MIAYLPRSEKMDYKAMSAWENDYLNSGSTAHLVIDHSILSKNRKLSRCSIGTVSGKVVKAKKKGTSQL